MRLMRLLLLKNLGTLYFCAVRLYESYSVYNIHFKSLISRGCGINLSPKNFVTHSIHKRSLLWRWSPNNLNCQGGRGRPRMRFGKECPHWTTINCPPRSLSSTHSRSPRAAIQRCTLGPRLLVSAESRKGSCIRCRITGREDGVRFVTFYTRIKSLKADVDIRSEIWQP